MGRYFLQLFVSFVSLVVTINHKGHEEHKN